MTFLDHNGDTVNIDIVEDQIENLQEGEVVKSVDGEMYEVISIGNDTIEVELIEVEEDWGE